MYKRNNLKKYKHYKKIRMYDNEILDVAIEKAKYLARKALSGLNSVKEKLKEKFPKLTRLISVILSLSGLIDSFQAIGMTLGSAHGVLTAITSNLRNGERLFAGMRQGFPLFLQVQIDSFFTAIKAVLKFIIASHLV